MDKAPEVYKAIVGVAGDIAKTGISKSRDNQSQGYKFRGIDDVYNELSGLLAKHGLCVLPRVLERTCVEKVNRNGNTLFYITVDVEFDFVACADGSKHTVRTFGEAMDSGDKATNKAMSAAYKYAAFQAFCIPTEGDNDADAHTHEVKPSNNQPIVPAKKKASFIEAVEELLKGIPDGDIEKILAIFGIDSFNDVKDREEQKKIFKTLKEMTEGGNK